MKTEHTHPGITVLRLTALANAGDMMIHAVRNEDGFEEPDAERRLRAATIVLQEAIMVARGDESIVLPSVLFEHTADRAVVRRAVDYGLIAREP